MKKAAALLVQYREGLVVGLVLLGLATYHFHG